MVSEMICENCGTALSEAANFCHECGKPTKRDKFVLEGEYSHLKGKFIDAKMVKEIALSKGWDTDQDFYSEFNKDPHFHYLIYSPERQRRIRKDHSKITLSRLSEDQYGGISWVGETVEDYIGYDELISFLS